MLHLAQFDHLTGLLAAAVLAGDVLIDDVDTRQQLMHMWHQELLSCVVLEAVAVQTGQQLDDAGVPWRLTKGAALAHLDYPDPSYRTFGDVDIVVHPDHWSTALRTLTAGGYDRSADALPGDYDDRYGKGATLTTPAGYEVDLHRRFAIGRFGVTSRMSDVFEEVDHITLAGRPVPTLSPEHRLLHACYHASLGGFRRLRAFRDVAQLILLTEVDWANTLETARRWRAEAVVASAIAESWRRLQLNPAHPAHRKATGTPISRGDQRALRVFASGRPFRSQALTSVSRLSPSEIPRYLWSLGAPHTRRSRG